MKVNIKSFGRIGILMGGISSEREISLKSGRAVFDALLRRGCDVVAIDITDKNSENVLAQVFKNQIDVAFLTLHGRFGEDGTIQLILEEEGIPYTGCGVEASRRAIDKIITQTLLKENGINVASHVIVEGKKNVELSFVLEQLGRFPVVIKPSREGSSIGITIAYDEKEFKEGIDLAFGFDERILIEKYIEGREMTVGIFDEEPLPVVEICPQGDFFDFKAKYQSGTTEYVVPARLSFDVTRSLQGIALEVYKILGCSSIARVDFNVDRELNPFVLEVNTIPGFTSMSLLPKAASKKGISFEQLCLRLVELAYAKKKTGKNPLDSLITH